MKRKWACAAALIVSLFFSPEIHAQNSGRIDLGFNPDLGAQGAWYSLVSDVAVDAENRVLVAGAFTNFNNSGRRGIARLLSNDQVDAAFGQNGGVDGRVESVLVQTDSIVLRGDFETYDGHPATNLVRISTSGVFDSTFQPPVLKPTAIASSPDGGVFVGSSISQTDYALLRKLTPTGEIDPNFGSVQTVTNVENMFEIQPTLAVLAISVQTDGKILIGGTFKSVNGVATGPIARLQSDGTVDLGFHADIPPVDGKWPEVTTVAISRSEIFIGGAYIGITPNNGFCKKLQYNGSLKNEFIRSAFPGLCAVTRVQLQSDSKVLVSLSISSDAISGQPSSEHLVKRFRATGELDPDFAPALFENIDFPSVNSIATQSDGNVVAGGEFYKANEENRIGVCRIINTVAPVVESVAVSVFEVSLVIVGSTGTQYAVEGSDSVKSDSWSQLKDFVMETNRTTVAIASPSPLNQFLRVRMAGK